jgi:hypothetical protein
LNPIVSPNFSLKSICLIFCTAGYPDRPKLSQREITTTQDKETKGKPPWSRHHDLAQVEKKPSLIKDEEIIIDPHT